MSLFVPKLITDDKQLLAVNLLSQNMPKDYEFKAGKPNFDIPMAVLNQEEKQTPAELIVNQYSFEKNSTPSNFA